MHYDITQIFTLGAVQCSLAAGFFYMHPLQKRTHFMLRFILCAFIALLVAPLLKLYQSGLTTLFRNGTESRYLLGLAFVSCGDLMITLLLLGTIVWVCCNLQWHKALYCAVCSYLTQDIAYTVFVIIMPGAANRGANPVQPGTLWIEAVVMLAICSFFILLFAQKLSENGDYRFRCNRSLPAMLLIIFFARILGTYAKHIFDFQSNGTFIMILIYDVLLSTTLLVTQLLQRKEEGYRTAAALEAQLRLLQKQQYEDFRANMDVINHKCHDLKHLVTALCGEADSVRKKELLQELKQDVMIYDANMNTGNDVLDALLSEAWMNCYHKDVQWTCMADGSALRFMDAIDLYILLGNALDNAVESAAQVEESQKRFICINIWQKERMAFIKIENYCMNIPAFRNGLPVTTKSTPLEHGYGMRSIQSVVQHYDGELKVAASNHIFIVSMMFPIPMNSEDEQ